MEYRKTGIVYDPFSMDLSATEILNNRWISPAEINSLGFRSHEFGAVENKKNILFAGCSVTYGDGLFLEETWAHKVWKKINNVGPFQNLSSVGRSIQTICFEIIKFCNTYGNPETVVVMLPDSQRCVRYDFQQSKHFVYALHPKKIDEEDQVQIDSLLANSFQAYRMLEIFCDMNNIKLFAYSWNSDLEQSFADFGFKTFHSFEANEFAKLVASHEQTLKKEDLRFSIYARDGVLPKSGHPGISLHLAWSDIIYNKIKELI